MAYHIEMLKLQIVAHMRVCSPVMADPVVASTSTLTSAVERECLQDVASALCTPFAIGCSSIVHC